MILNNLSASGKKSLKSKNKGSQGERKHKASVQEKKNKEGLHSIAQKGLSYSVERRLANESRHPSYKNIDMAKCLAEKESGKPISQICRENGITRRTYYNKLRKMEKENSYE